MNKDEIAKLLKPKRTVSKSEFSKAAGIDRKQVTAIEEGRGYSMDSFLAYIKAAGLKIFLTKK